MKLLRNALINIIGLGLFLVSSTPASFAFTSNDAIIVERQMPSEAEPGETITVELTVSTDIGVSDTIRGFYISEQVAEELTIDNATLLFNDPGIDFTLETGSTGDIYNNAFPFRCILETPPEFLEDNPLDLGVDDELIVRYAITIPVNATIGTEYVFPGFSWVGRVKDSNNQTVEDIFGYENLPEFTLVVIPTTTTTTTNTDPGGGDSPGGGGGGGGGGSAPATTTVPKTTSTTTVPYEGGVDTSSTTTTVQPPPVHVEINSEPVAEAFVGILYSYDVGVTAGGQMLTYSLNEHPSGMQIDEKPGVVTWKPKIKQLGNHDVEIQVADESGETDVQKFVIKVRLSQKCPMSLALDENEKSLSVLRKFRDRRLLKSTPGLSLIALYYTHGTEITKIMSSHPELISRSKELIMEIIPILEENPNTAGKIVLTKTQHRKIIELMNLIKEKTSPELHSVVSSLLVKFESTEFFKEIGVEIEGE